VAVVERPRVAQVRVVEQLAHARFDADADACGRVAPREVDQEADRGEPEFARQTSILLQALERGNA